MARNRRHQSAAMRFGPALKAMVICLLIGGSAVGYVWQKDQLRQLGDRIAKGEQSLKALHRQNELLTEQLDVLRSTANLERLARQHNPGLLRPAPDQVIRLREPGYLLPKPPEVPGSSQYAARRTGTGWPQ